MFETIITGDGSKTYRNTKVGATYRSTHGARAESHYVFFSGTKLQERADVWRVLELGFGTGMNFDVTRREAEEAGVSLEYVSLEPNLIPAELWLVEEQWQEAASSSPFQLKTACLNIIQEPWQEYQPQQDYFQAVYHDPFGPGPAPECWTKECFEWSHRALTEDGILATYGASTAARKAMKEAGFHVGTLPGAMGKREMTVASKSLESLSGSRAWKRFQA